MTRHTILDQVLHRFTLESRKFRKFCFTRDDHRLQPREVDPQTLHQYAMFIENLLIHSGKSRYLSKMNQGIEWVASIAGYFDRSVFLVPFREPRQQAASLLSQHNNFSRLSRYESKYLGWIEHHEFGATHLGFFENQEQVRPAFSPENFNYWLEQWKTVTATCRSWRTCTRTSFR
ncbi:MAG: hypothetical protein GY815_00420 [Gammaproteobacteria bacterium]|nr:hypothetical protein [Gammaproteobacteria bacterium]